MNCKNCGGSIRFEKGIGICEACGSRFEPEQAFENTEVFIAYVEADEQGRRTKDSLLAQDLYNRLENAKIHTFYERVSAAELADDSLEQANYSALYRADIVLLLGTNPEHFETLLETYRSELESKTLLPVYGGMNAYDLPLELQKLQAMNYEAIGASADLTKRILNLLGRESEKGIGDYIQKAERKRKILLFSAIGGAVLLILAAIATFILIQKMPEIRIEKAYKNASAAYEKQLYADAISALWEIKDYKDSKNLLQKSYAHYSGCYISKDQSTELELTINKQFIASVNLLFTNQGATIEISESILANATKIELNFSNGTESGIACLNLNNDHILCQIDFDNTDNDIEQTIPLDSKLDMAAINNIVNKKMLEDWLDSGKTVEQIQNDGYNLILEERLEAADQGGIPLFQTCFQYKIKHTNIHLLFTPTDASYQETNYGSTEIPEKFQLTAVCAPAGLLIPDEVNQKKEATFALNNRIYTRRLSGEAFSVKEGQFSIFIPEYGCWLFSGDLMNKKCWEVSTITPTDLVILCGKPAKREFHPDVDYEKLLKDLTYAKPLSDFINQAHPDGWSHINYDVFGENNSRFLCSIYITDNSEESEKSIEYILIIDKKTQKLISSKKITELYDENGFSIAITLKYLYDLEPQTYGEFVTEEIKARWEVEEWENSISELDGEIMYVASEDVLNLRAEPSTESEIIDVMPIGQKLLVLSMEGDWAEVQFMDKTGYCAAEFLSSTKPLEEP